MDYLVSFIVFLFIKCNDFVEFSFVLVIIFFYSFYAINNYTKNLTNKDPKEVVIDEVIGQSIPLYLYEISHNFALFAPLPQNLIEPILF